MADRSSPDEVSLDIDSMDTTNFQQTESQLNRIRYVDEYLQIYYKKQLDQPMKTKTKEILENLFYLYDQSDEETANSYVLSFILLRVGCEAKTYEFETFIESDRSERDQIVKNNWSGEKVLMRIRRKDDQIEKNFERFDAFFSSFASIRFVDLIQPTDETNLKKILRFLIEETQTNLIEYRFTVLLTLRSIVRGLLTTVTHSRRNKNGKISPFIGQKDAEKIFEFVSKIIDETFVLRLTDSEIEISDLAHESINDFVEICPNFWTTKSLFDQCLYSILSQEEKNSFEYSIGIFRRILTHRDFEKDRYELFFEYVLLCLSAEDFQIVSTSNFISMFKLLNDLFTIYPEHFSLKIICHWSTGIFDENIRIGKLSMNFYLRFIQMSENHLQPSIIWSYLTQLYQSLFQNSICEEVTARFLHSIEIHRDVSHLIENLSSFEHFLSIEDFQQNSTSKNLIFFQLIRSLFVLHLNRQRNSSSNDEQILLHQLSRIYLRSMTNLFQKNEIEKSLLIECFLGFQTTFSYLNLKDLEDNSVEFSHLIDLFQLHLTTHQLAQTNI